jgi:hypothetical protein
MEGLRRADYLSANRSITAEPRLAANAGEHRLDPEVDQ